MNHNTQEFQVPAIVADAACVGAVARNDLPQTLAASAMKLELLAQEKGP